MRTLEAYGDEVARLRTAYDMSSPKAVQERRFVEHASRSIRRKGVAKWTKPKDQKFIEMLNENLLAKQRERETRAKIREKSELLGHPPDPRASSIAAAVMADSALADGMREKMRPNGKGGYSVFRAYDFEDISVLFTVLHLLQAGGRVHAKNVASTPVFADHELPRVSQLGRSLSQLRRNGWLEAEFEGSDAYYVYGPRVREIAKRWGITLREPETAKEAAQATA